MSVAQTISITGKPFTLNTPFPISSMIGATIENESPYNLLVTSGGSQRNTPAQCLDFLILPTTGTTIQVQPTLVTPDAGGLISEAIVTWYVKGDTMPSLALPIALPRSLEIGGNVDIGNITGTVTVSGNVDIGSGTVDIGNTPTVTIGAGSSPIDISSGTVNIGGGQSGTSTNVSTQTPPEQLPGSPFSYSTTSTESNTSFTIDIPLSATTLGMVFSYTVPTGNQLVQITGNTSNTTYFSSYVSPLDYELVAVNGSLDTALTVKVYCGSSASGKAYFSALAGEGAINITNNELQPVIIQGTTVASNIGTADNWLYPPDVITMGSNAVGNTGTPKYDQVVQGANSTGQPWDVEARKSWQRVQLQDGGISLPANSGSGSGVIVTFANDATILSVDWWMGIVNISVGNSLFRLWLVDDNAFAHLFDDMIFVPSTNNTAPPSNTFMHGNRELPVPHRVYSGQSLTLYYQWLWNTPSVLDASCNVHLDGINSFV